MRRRLILVLIVAVVWSVVVRPMLGMTFGWMLLGAAVIGILGTIGLEPPRRRSFAHLARVGTMLRSVRTKG